MNKGIVLANLSDNPYMPILETGLDFNALVFHFSYYHILWLHYSVAIRFVSAAAFTKKEDEPILGGPIAQQKSSR